MGEMLRRTPALSPDCLVGAAGTLASLILEPFKVLENIIELNILREISALLKGS